MPTVTTIYFNADGYQLAASLHMPGRPKPPVVVGCHGLLADRTSPKQISLASACNQRGLAYLRFDHRGCGDSQGDFNEVTSLSARRQDLYHAVKTLQHHSELGPVIALFGSSFGGSVVLAYAARYSAPALITYAAPINSADINRSGIRDIKGQVPSKTLLTDALTFDLAKELKAIQNILVAHSHDDETVPVDHAHQIYEAAVSPKKIVIFNNGDHRMSDSAHQKKFENDFIAWISQKR